MSIGSSILLIAVGAILKYAVTTHVSGVNIQTVGLILLLLGILGLVLSLLYTFVWSSRGPAAPVAERDLEPPTRNLPPRDRF